MLNRALLIIFISALLLFSQLAFAKNLFSYEEQKYINSKNTLIVGITSENEPYSFFRNGQISGYSIDYLDMVAEAGGFNFDYRIGNWSDIYTALLNEEIDLVDGITYTPERVKSIIFTNPYHIRKIIMVEREKSSLSNYQKLSDIKQKRIGYLKDVYYANYLNSLDFQSIQFSNNLDMLKSLMFGWLDAAFVSELTARFIKETNNFNTLARVENIDISEIENEDLRLGINKNNPILASVLNKSLKQITESQIEALQNKWQLNTFQGLDSQESQRLTKEEMEFIKKHPTISVATSLDFYPFSFTENNIPQGFTISILGIISSRTGITFDIKQKPWALALKAFLDGKVDIIADITYTDERSKHALFTNEYARIPTYVFIKDDFGKYEGLESFKGKRIGILKDVFYLNALKTDNSSTVVQYEALDNMFMDLSIGKLDVALTSLNIGGKFLREYAFSNIELAGEFKVNSLSTEDLRFGINPKYPLLYSIMEKSLNNITQEEKISLENRWIISQSKEQEARKVVFTEEEKELLKKKKNIKLCVDPNWMPIEKLEDDLKYIGIAADLLKIMEKNSGLKISIYPSKTWSESLLYAQERKCDAISLTMPTDSKEKYFDFTSPYLSIPVVVATSVNTPFIDDINSVMNNKFAVIKDYSINSILKEKYPFIELVEVDDMVEGLALVQNGEVFGAIGSMASIGYQIKQLKILDVKISGRLPINWELSVAVRNDEPMLFYIFQKLVNSITEQEKSEIISKWMAVRFDQEVDYSLLWKVFFVLITIALVATIWSDKLRRLNKNLTDKNKKLQELSNIDSLTGLYNRRHLDESSAVAFNMCKRNKLVFSFGIIDIDHFKNINDTYGHFFGDICLKELAIILKEHFQRQTDTCARFGGEEFAVFTTDAQENILIHKFDSFRQAIEANVVEHDGIKASFTVSGGLFSLIPNTDDELSDVFKKADEALYAAKNSGRNRIIIWTEDIEQK